MMVDILKILNFKVYMRVLRLSIPRKINKVRMLEILFSIGAVLIIIIPKGGFKIAGIPLTWGYLYLGLLFLLIINSIIRDNEKHFIPLRLLICYFASLLFFLFFIFHLITYGYDGKIGNLIAYIVNFGFLPFLFLIILPPYLSRISQKFINEFISKSLFIVSLYGISLFIIKNIFKIEFEIPYITINADDLGLVATDKYNQRGNVMKLVSTYNNGNIFGVCMLILFPILFFNCKEKYKILVVVIALILTLSRTVWLGLICFFFIVYSKKILQLLKYFLIGTFLISIISLLFFTSKFQYGSLTQFVLDPRLGGRIEQIKQSLEVSFLGVKPFSNIEEIVYLSVFKQFGIIGLFIYLIAFFTPIFIFNNSTKNNSQYILGVILYAIVSMSDGCTLFIPTLAFFFFVVAMSFIKNRIQEN